jgi:hypothetical protein
MISALAWVPRGAAKPVQDEPLPTEDELAAVKVIRNPPGAVLSPFLQSTYLFTRLLYGRKELRFNLMRPTA